MPPGQTPHTIMLFSHNDLVDAVQPGDRYVLFLIILLESRLHTVWPKFLWVLIFAIFPAICKNKFPQIKITANIFSVKFTAE